VWQVPNLSFSNWLCCSQILGYTKVIYNVKYSGMMTAICFSQLIPTSYKYLSHQSALISNLFGMITISFSVWFLQEYMGFVDRWWGLSLFPVLQQSEGSQIVLLGVIIVQVFDINGDNWEHWNMSGNTFWTCLRRWSDQGK